MRYRYHDVHSEKRLLEAQKPGRAGTVLLCVSTQLKEEVLPLYLAKNLFVLPCGHVRTTLQSMLSTHQSVYGTNARQHLRQLSITLHPNEGQMTDHDIGAILKQAPNAGNASEAARMRFCHNRRVDVLVSTWADFGRHIGKHLSLHELEINVDNAHCWLGCCRPVERGFYALYLHAWTHPPKLLRVKGAQSERERTAAKFMNAAFKAAKTEVQFV